MKFFLVLFLVSCSQKYVYMNKETKLKPINEKEVSVFRSTSPDVSKLKEVGIIHFNGTYPSLKEIYSTIRDKAAEKGIKNVYNVNFDTEIRSRTESYSSTSCSGSGVSRSCSTTRSTRIVYYTYYTVNATLYTTKE